MTLDLQHRKTIEGAPLELLEKLNLNLNDPTHLALHIIDSSIKLKADSVQIEANKKEDEKTVEEVQNNKQVLHEFE